MPTTGGFSCSAIFAPGKGGGADDDGVFRFQSMMFVEIDMQNHVVGTHKFSGIVPLEVGYTSASKTFWHFAHSGVARWPYGCDTIRVYARRRAFEGSTRWANS